VQFTHLCLAHHEVTAARDSRHFAESCGLSDINTWNELQDYPIVQVSFNADSMNVSVSSPPLDKPTYPTRITLTGPITFQ